MSKKVAALFASFLLLGILAISLASCNSEQSTEDGSESQPSKPTQPESQQQSPKKDEPEPIEPNPDPVTLTIYNPNSGDLEEDFMRQYGNQIEQKFPHITLNYLHSPDTNPRGHLTDLIAANQTIDIFLNADTNHYRLITPFEFQYDITELVQKHNYDLNQLEPSTVDAVRALSDGGLYALPFKMSVLTLMYNRELFDDFGVEHPVDGMTWDETYELARSMTRSDGNAQVRGFVTQSYPIAWTNQWSVGFADPETDEPLLYTDDRWAELISNINRFYEIPGNAFIENSFRPIQNAFFVDQTVAMYAYTIPNVEYELNWDLVTLPEFDHLPGVGSQAMLTFAYIVNISQHKDEAFQVIAYMTSDEFQTNISKQALGLPVVTTQSVQDAFGAETPFLQGKNLAALMKNSPAPPFEQSPYQAIVNQELEKLWYQLGKSELDVNTTLRMAAENAQQEIAALKASGQ